MATIYCHINKINNKKYIGITKTSAERRWGNNGENYKGQVFYEKGVVPFGWDNFNHIILNDDLPYDLIQQIEARLIKELDLTNPDKGYNESEGVIILKNDIADNLTLNFLKRIESNIPKKKTLEDFQFVSYSYHNVQHELESLYSLYQDGRLNTDLDCQRDYVWDEARQQGMWDTLLRGCNIPQIHAIQSDWNLDVADGKQRLLTCFKILNDEIPLTNKHASPQIKNFLEILERKKVFFSELPEKFKIHILRSRLSFAEYINMTDEDIIDLFRKLNSGKPLGDFAAGIANNILIRTKFTRYLMTHPVLGKMFPSSEEEKEKFLVRTLFLIHYGGMGKVDLSPRALPQKYVDFSTQMLSNYRNQILEGLNNFASLVDLIDAKFKAKGSYYPIIFYSFLSGSLTKEYLEKILPILSELPSVRGNDLGKKEQEKYFNNLKNLTN